MKTQRERSRIRTGIFPLLYCLFTILCGILSRVFPEQRIILFQIWYRTTAIIWLVLAMIAVILTIKFLKLNKLWNEFNHWKE